MVLYWVTAYQHLLLVATQVLHTIRITQSRQAGLTVVVGTVSAFKVFTLVGQGELVPNDFQQKRLVVLNNLCSFIGGHT